MRRLKRIKRLVALMLSVAVLTNTFNISAYADEEGVYEAEQNATTEAKGWDGVTTKQVYEAENYNVIFNLTGHWSGGYNATVRIENASDEIIHNWYIAYNSSYDISNIWNGEIYQSSEETSIIKNATWNQDIPVGGSVEFGFIGVGEFSGFPTEYKLVTSNAETPTEDYIVEYVLNSDWGSGFSGNIIIKNNSDRTLEDWTLELDFNRDITNIWNGVIDTCNENHYIIRNAGYNSNIASGESVTFGFTGANGSKETVPLNFKLCTYEVNTSETDTMEYVQLADGMIDKAYIEKAIYPQLVRDGLPTEDVRLEDDFDNDGLTLIQEYDYDTNPFSDDTDEDGLSDLDEINLYETNPINSDTDSDGMSDGTEISCGLNPLKSDTDEDGIADDEEIITQQVRINAVKTYELEDVGTLPSVELTGKGDYSQEIYASAIEYDETILDIDCLVGTAYDFVHDEALDFESGELTFAISDDVLEEYELEDLAIAWYNEEENSLELLETAWDEANGTISAKVEHFSIYMVVSSHNYFRNIDITNPNYIVDSPKADIVFVIESTDSMETKISNIRSNLERFFNMLQCNQVDVRIGLIEYKDVYDEDIEPTKAYNWYTSVEDFESQLPLMGANDNEDIPHSIKAAINCASQMKYRVGAHKYIILITDSGYADGISADLAFDDEVAGFIKRDISVSVITDEKYYADYSGLTNRTAGIIGNINENFSPLLTPIIVDICADTKLSYWFEYKYGLYFQCMGDVSDCCWVRLSNGFIVKLDKDPSLGDETVDTDKDGIPDIIELKDKRTVFSYNRETKQMEKIETWSFYSNPIKADTDGDGISDADDINPCSYDITAEVIEDTAIKFNTGKTWYYVGTVLADFFDSIYPNPNSDNQVDSEFSYEELMEAGDNIVKNSEQDFAIEELTVIGLYDNQGSKYYMDDVSKRVRETVFKNLTGRECKYYQHTGGSSSSAWEEVPYGTTGGFWTGIVVTEADLNFTTGAYAKVDVYTIIEYAVQLGVVIIAAIVITEVTPLVVANMQALAYYINNFGIKQGLEMYKYLGVESLPNGVISWLQMDMGDGDSSLDDLVDSSIPIYQRGMKGEEALQQAHPGEAHVYFETYVDGVKGGRYVDVLSEDIAYEAKVGYTCLSQRVRMQIMKDAYLIDNKYVSGAVWEFYRSDITGRVGASPQLLKFLEYYGITYVIHE